MTRTPEEIYAEISAALDVAATGRPAHAPADMVRRSELYGRMADLWAELRQVKGIPAWGRLAAVHAEDDNRDIARLWAEHAAQERRNASGAGPLAAEDAS